ncbi:hypothetical protein SORBI_3003G369566 [Sorghum bicolor]|uniref:Uncharacterized protein n=1 Tax=Sorghum bicolor TaxID=4558 RepID=A0A1W0W0P1_SORBI|nr:hypothetical protein SORBI_3003G369566 [Sorghum bicolor]
MSSYRSRGGPTQKPMKPLACSLSNFSIGPCVRRGKFYCFKSKVCMSKGDNPTVSGQIHSVSI